MVSEVSFYPTTGAERTADRTWRLLLGSILKNGNVVSPRGLRTKEILGMQTVVDLQWPIVTNAARKIGYKFMAAEAAWILSGDNRVETIAPYAKHIVNFSDDGQRFFGAYGPKVVDQLSHVVQTLAADPSSRQAVINIWRENPRASKDIPCTISHQFMIRDGRLNLFTTMRSSDAWLGWPYDTFNGCMLAGLVTLWLAELNDSLKKPAQRLKPGRMYLTAASSHLYAPQWEAAEKIAQDAVFLEGFPYKRFCPYDFDKPADLVDHLWQMARGGGGARLCYDFMREAFNVDPA